MKVLQAEFWWITFKLKNNNEAQYISRKNQRTIIGIHIKYLPNYVLILCFSMTYEFHKNDSVYIYYNILLKI